MLNSRLKPLPIIELPLEWKVILTLFPTVTKLSLGISRPQKRPISFVSNLWYGLIVLTGLTVVVVVDVGTIVVFDLDFDLSVGLAVDWVLIGFACFVVGASVDNESFC